MKTKSSEPRLCVGEDDEGHMLGISSRSLRKLGITSFKVGRLTRYRVKDIERFVQKQAEAADS